MSWDDIDKSIDLSIKFGSKNINRIKNHCYYYDCGDDELILGFYDKAIQYFNVAIELNPNNSEYYYKRSKAYAGLKQ